MLIKDTIPVFNYEDTFLKINEVYYEIKKILKKNHMNYLNQLKEKKIGIIDEINQDNISRFFPNHLLSKFEAYHQNYIQPEINEKEYFILEKVIYSLEKEVNLKSKVFFKYLELVKELLEGKKFKQIKIKEPNSGLVKAKNLISKKVIERIQEKLDEKIQIEDTQFYFINRISNNRDMYILQIEDERTRYKRAIVQVEEQREVAIYLSENIIQKIYFDLYFFIDKNNNYDILSTKTRLRNLGKCKSLPVENKILQISNKKGEEEYLFFINNSYIILAENIKTQIKNFKNDDSKKKKEYFYFEIPLKISVEDYYIDKIYEKFTINLMKSLKTYALIDKDLNFLCNFTRGAEKSYMYMPRIYKIKMGQEEIKYLKVASLMSIIPQKEIDRLDERELKKIYEGNKKETFGFSKTFIFLTNDNLKYKHFSFSNIIEKDYSIYKINKIHLEKIIEEKNKIVLYFMLDVVDYFNKSLKSKQIMQIEKIDKSIENNLIFMELKE